MRDGSTGYPRMVTSPGGMTPGLGQYNVFGAAGIRAELLDSSGATIYEGAATSTAVAASLGALLLAGGCPAEVFGRAVGAVVLPSADVRYNTSGSSDDGSAVNAPAPGAASPSVWTGGQAYAIGWVAR